jgi:hypothetical protein
MAMVIEQNDSPEVMERIAAIREECISARMPLFHSFEAAANAISLVAGFNEKYPGRLS